MNFLRPLTPYTDSTLHIPDIPMGCLGCKNVNKKRCKLHPKHPEGMSG